MRLHVEHASLRMLISRQDANRALRASRDFRVARRIFGVCTQQRARRTETVTGIVPLRPEE